MDHTYKHLLSVGLRINYLYSAAYLHSIYQKIYIVFSSFYIKCVTKSKKLDYLNI